MASVWTAGQVGARFATIFAVSVAVAIVATALAFQARGLAVRQTPAASAAPVFVDDSAELLEAWDGELLNGAVLVSTATQFGFQNVGHMGGEGSYPLEIYPFRDGIRASIARDNRVWVGASRGYFRTVHHVLPQSVLSERVAEGLRQGYEGISPDGSRITANANGYIRQIAAQPPRLAEPVVLDVDASYFDSGTPQTLLEQIRAAQLDVRFVTYNRALDDTPTTDVARERLDEFARLFEEGR